MPTPVPAALRNFSPLKDMLLLGCVLVLFFSATLGLRPYGTPSEARYIEIPRQMAITGDWVTPRLNGVKYFEKPPLFYWVQAAQIRLFGLGEFSGRLWTMLGMVAICLLTSAAGAKLYGRSEGLLAALILATSTLGFGLSRMAMLDVPVSLFLTGCLFAFLFAVREPPGKRREALLLGMYACAAGAVLAKGLIGLLLPGLIVGVWMALTRNFSLLLRLRLVPGILLVLALAAPWHVLAGLRTPEFFRFYFIHEHFERFLTTVHHRVEPWWFFGAVLAVGWLPWTFFLPQAIREGMRGAWARRREDGTVLYLAVWIIVPLLFFSLSHSKLIPYIFPVFPPMALLLGRYFAQIWREGADKGYRRSTRVFIAVLCGAIAASPLVWHIFLQRDPSIENVTFEWVSVLTLLGATALAQAIMLWRKARGLLLVLSLVAYAGAQALMVDMAVEDYTPDSIRPLAEALKPVLRDGDEVIAFNHYYQDLPVYLNRNVTVVNAQGELAFGVSIEPATRGWMIDEAELWRRWRQPGHKIYMVMRRNSLQNAPFPKAHPPQVVAGTNRHVLVSN